MTARDIVMSAAGNAGDSKTYIEDVFSTYLYTGNGTSQTINNGIDLAGKGGMVWTKCRDTAYSNALVDTNRGTPYVLCSDRTDSQFNYPDISSFNSNGYTIGQNYSSWFNASSKTYASWTFRKAPKFFDVVTYTGNGAGNRQIAHSLGVVPGMVIVKCTSSGSTGGATGEPAGWVVGHRSLPGGAGSQLFLNRTDANAAWGDLGSINPTSTHFVVSGYYDSNTNGNGQTYVAYLFAHDDTTDGLIQCGLCSAGTEVNLGWEPQWVLVKPYAGNGYPWRIYDSMRGATANYGNTNTLRPNDNGNESSDGQFMLTSTGFKFESNAIYMAIRRGPMKTPTDGTKVFTPSLTLGDGGGITTNYPVDAFMFSQTSGGSKFFYDRMRGDAYSLDSTSTSSETNQTSSYGVVFSSNTGSVQKYFASSSYGNIANWLFRRAPGFFDVVCYTGTGSPQDIRHNLGVIPELMIVKNRSTTSLWAVFAKALGADQYLRLNTNDSSTTNTAIWNNTLPTTTAFSVYSNNATNMSGSNHIAYLFASCPGVSKVGSYTGNGSSQTINCGFTGGARFVLIKRTDSTGDWYVWDTARGIVTGNDPHLSLNTTAAEVTSDDTIDPDSTGFIVNQNSTTNVNVSGASYIYLAIA